MATTNFDLCDVLTLVNTLGVDWQPKHIIIGFFGVIKIIDQTLERNSTVDLLDQYGLKKTIVACERWKVKFKCYDYNIKMSCKYWRFQLGRKFLKDMFWAWFF